MEYYIMKLIHTCNVHCNEPIKLWKICTFSPFPSSCSIFAVTCCCSMFMLSAWRCSFLFGSLLIKGTHKTGWVEDERRVLVCLADARRWRARNAFAYIQNVFLWEMRLSNESVVILNGQT